MARKLTLTALAALALLCPVAPADAARRTPAPKITKVSPLDAAIGQTLYIRGRNLNAGRRRPTVVFQRADGRAVFQAARSATRTKLTVQVPSRLQKLLATGEGGATQTTVFTLRIVARRAGQITRAALSPRIGLAGGGAALPTPDDEALADCDSDGANDRDDQDDDNDFLADALEDELRMNPCAVDSDGDGMEDGWEYHSARDLNRRNVPYPAQRPYPNALDPSDARTDFDGDSMSSAQEHAAWLVTGRVLDHGRAYSPLGYSDGTQTSDPYTPPAQPAFRSAEYGIAFSAPPYPESLDLDGDGRWQDEERDVDADGIANFDELHGRATFAWMQKTLAALNVEPWTFADRASYGTFGVRPFAALDPFDPDSDGDGLLDAEDDQDHDDFNNIEEFYGWSDAGAAYLLGDPPATPQPFNPCAPSVDSRTCPRH